MDIEEIYKRLLFWQARPKHKDDPQTRDEFCAKYNITKGDLAALEQRPEYPNDLLSETMAWAKGKTPELIQSIYREVKQTKNVADLERFLNVIHEIKRKDKTTNTQVNFFNSLTPEQYESIVIREARVLAPGSDQPAD